MAKNNKLVSLKIPDKVSKILSKLEREEDSVYLFRELEGVNLNDKKRVRTRIKKL